MQFIQGAPPQHRTVRNEVSPSFLAAGFASAIHSARIAIGSSIPMNSPVHPHMLLQAAATAAGASVPNPGQIGLSDCLKNYFFSQKNKLSEEEEPLKAEQKYAADGRRRIQSNRQPPRHHRRVNARAGAAPSSAANNSPAQHSSSGQSRGSEVRGDRW